jgi:hypothetical protein
MKKIVLIILTFACSLCNAQNLVNNWSFEDTVACPNSLTQIDRAVGWMSFGLTPDYFNACAPSNVPAPLSVPHNIWGDQLAHSGSGYSCFIAFASAGSATREYIASQLNQTMIIGEKYFLSYWVSSTFGYIQNGYPGLACNNLGAKFSTVAYSQTNPQPVNNFAHIVDTNIINDTTNWVKISGSFIADSAYKYISIGNFFDNNLTSYQFIGVNFNQAVYYLDDVKLSTDSDFVNGIENIEINLVKIFPNPARDWIVVSGSRLEEVDIYNATGSLCYKNTDLSASASIKINLFQFSEGLYFILGKSATSRFSQKILIIKN